MNLIQRLLYIAKDVKPSKKEQKKTALKKPAKTTKKKNPAPKAEPKKETKSSNPKGVTPYGEAKKEFIKKSLSENFLNVFFTYGN